MAHNIVQIMADNYPVLVDGRGLFFVGDDGKRLNLTTDIGQAMPQGELDRANAVAERVGQRLGAAVMPLSERPAADIGSDREARRLLIALADCLRINEGDGRHIDAFLEGYTPAEWALAKATIAERANKGGEASD